jgi:dipeptidase E
MLSRQFVLWGGFPMVDHRLLAERYLLSLTKKKSPKICFVPTASGDSEFYCARFLRRFSKLSCEPSVLALFQLSIRNIEKHILDQDLLFVGGGNTLNMLAIWRARDLNAVFLEALNQGSILSGVSAGSICWFESGLSDSVAAGDFRPLACLGFLAGSNCPHYDGEPGRQKIFRNLIAKKEIQDGFAADDGVGLHFVEGKFVEAVSLLRSAKAYRVVSSNGKAKQTTIEPRLLGKT